jgi:hypothetical protein
MVVQIRKKVSGSAQNFFMFMMFMWVAGASDYTSFNFGKNPVLMPIFILILLYYYVRYCKYSFKPLLIIVSVFALWTFMSMMKYGQYTEIDYPIFYSIIIAHVAFNIYSRDEFFCVFEKILVRFCLLSLIVWLCANIIGEPFVNFMRSISVIKSSPPTETYSFLVGLGSQFEMGLRRNIGFTWEPGVFSCWVLLGIYINLVRNNFTLLSFKENHNFYILLATLLSTLSTTGYSILAILILFVLLNKKSISFKIFIIVLCIVLIPTILSLSFMSDKIVGLMDLDQGLRLIDYYSTQEGYNWVTPQRFTGFYVAWLNFIHDPLLGYNQLPYSYVSKVLFEGSVVVAPSEGILAMLGNYGLFIGLFFYYWLIKSSVYLSKVFHYKGTLMFLIFFLAISFSYGFWENCIFMYFYLCTFYKKFDSRYFNVNPYSVTRFRNNTIIK